MAYPHTSLCGFSIGKSNARHAIRFFVEEHNVRDISDSGAFLPDIFFYLQHGCGVFLKVSSEGSSLGCNGKVNQKSRLGSDRMGWGREGEWGKCDVLEALQG